MSAVLECRAIHTTSREFMDFQSPSGFADWKGYRRKVIDKLESKE